MKKILVLILIASLILQLGTVSGKLYVTDVDDIKGLYRVLVDVNGTSIPAKYENRTLVIDIGDTVSWVNNVDNRITIVSKEVLLDINKSILRWTYNRFSYTFNESGKYEIYIKERPTLPHQIIMVGNLIEPNATVTPEEKITPTITPNYTVIVTPSYNYNNYTPISNITDLSYRKNNRLYEFGSFIVIAILIIATIFIFSKRYK